MYELLYQYFKDKTGIDKETFNFCADYFRVRKSKKNEVLHSAGEICKFNLFVNAGCVRFYSINEKGFEQTRYFAFEGMFGIALSNLINQEPAFECIQCIEESELLVISREDFFYLVNSVPQVNLIYRHILELAFNISQKRIYVWQGQSALDRLKWLLEYQPKILSRIPNKALASYLGVTPYTLSRLKAELWGK